VDLWKKMKSKNIGLITFSESEVDQIENIGEEEAKSVIPDDTKKTNPSFLKVKPGSTSF
jgi:hypothetical protein